MTDQDFSAIPPSALDTLDAVAAYLAAAFESGDADAMTLALANVAQSEGLAPLAAAAGLPRAGLAEAMRAGAMSLDTTLAIMKVIDLHMPPQLPASDGAGSVN
jgi:probable addiction module antidote protein